MKSLKKIICILLTLLTACAFPVSVSALGGDEITAPAAVLMDADSGKVLFEKNAHEKRACASITKVMTLILVFEAIDSGKISMTDNVTASAHAASMGGSDIWLEEGETMTVDEMIKATVVASANDAAVALAELVAGSEEEFVSQMNKKAKELNMKETTFKNCNGLDEEGHITSAYDVAIMSKELVKHKAIFEYTSIWMDYLRDGKTQIVNTNKLLKTYKGITGLKTGTTGDAGSCISATATRDGLSLIGVVLGSATGKERFTDAAKILDYGFANFSRFVPEYKEALPQVNVSGGMDEKINCKVNLGGSFIVEKGKGGEVKSELKMKEEIEAPVLAGDKVGSLVFKKGDQVLGEYDVVSESSVEKINFFAVFVMLIGSFISL